ncbi:MAG TPA: hypothetical protein VMT20_06340 [Terriglobia bacterium]|nr:hypothetical protein [Terriglobia bacterium]
MPLVNSPTLTPKKLAANRANAQLSRGPITADGLIRVRDSNIKHGAYAQDREEALRALGEDPKDFDALLESLKASWQPANALEELLVKRLARAIWRTERNDRLQESVAVRLVSEMTIHVNKMVANVCALYDEKVAHLEWLLESFAHDECVTGAEDLDHFEAVYGESPQGRPHEILVCLNLLLDPEEFGVEAKAEEGKDSEEEDESEAGDDEDRYAAGTASTEDGAEDNDELEATGETEADPREGNPLLLPDVPIATGPERKEAWKRMTSLLREEIEAWKATRDRDREDLLKTNAPYFRDSAVAKSKPESEVLLRREDSSFRQVGRLIDLLTKLKRDAWHAENKKNNIENEGESHDVIDNKGQEFLFHDVVDNKVT